MRHAPAKRLDCVRFSGTLVRAKSCGRLKPSRCAPKAVLKQPFVSLGFFWFVSTQLQDKGSYKVIMLICGCAYVMHG
jgi:hypothetical protein